MCRHERSRHTHARTQTHARMPNHTERSTRVRMHVGLRYRGWHLRTNILSGFTFEHIHWQIGDKKDGNEGRQQKR